MYADEAELKTPRAIRTLLLDYGGWTPTNLPMFRFVQAGDCRILCQGRVHHFPPKINLSIEGAAPIRITNGIALMPRYRSIDPEHWILQKWFPPSVWGTAAAWREHRADEKDVPLFVREHPVNGDYFMLAGPWRTIEEAGDLRAPIRLYLRAEMEKHKDSENLVRQWMAEEFAEREERLVWMEQEVHRAQVSRAETLSAVSSDAQQVRDQWAAQAGLTDHLGASEGWG